MKHNDWNYLKQYYQYIKVYPFKLSLSLILIPTITVLHLSQPYLLKYGIDENILKGDFQNLTYTASFFGLIVILELVGRTYRNYLFQSIGIQALSQMRLKLFQHILKQSSVFFDKTPLGKLVNRTTSDMEALNHSVVSGGVTLLSDCVTMIGILIAMFLLDFSLTLVTCLFLPLLFIIINYFRKKLRYYGSRIRSTLSEMNAYLGEQIEGIQIIQLFLREKYNARQFHQKNNQYTTYVMFSIVQDAVLYSIIESLSSLVIALMIWYGMKQLQHNLISLGVLVAFIEYIRKFYYPLKEFSSKFAVIQQALAALEKIFTLFDVQETIPNGYKSLTEFQGQIRFHQVSFSYPGYEDKPILKNVSFEINPGEVVAIVGTTGSGKTTIVRLLSYLYHNYTGTIELDGHELRQINKNDLYTHLAIVTQNPFLFSQSIDFNIRLGNEAISELDMITASKLTLASDFIEHLEQGYQTILRGNDHMLSYGQAQLIAFSRALAKKTKVVLLDEATASIDSMTEKIIQKITENIFRTKTTLVVAHRLSTIRKANRIIVLNQGEIVESGTHDELMQKAGFYAKLFKMQYAQV